MTYIYWAPPGFLALQPTFGEGGVFHHLIILELYPHDAVTNFFTAIPGTVLGNEDLVAVRRRKHRAGVKAHAQSGYMRAQVQRQCYKILTGRLAPNSGSAISLLWQ